MEEGGRVEYIVNVSEDAEEATDDRKWWRVLDKSCGIKPKSYMNRSWQWFHFPLFDHDASNARG